MKLINSLFLLVLILFISSVKTQFISIERYEFSGNCKNGSGSSSASSFEASSESPAICLKNDLLSGIVTNEGVCLIFNEIPSTFIISTKGDYIIHSIFDQNDFNCQGNIIENKAIKIGECFNECSNDYHGSTFLFSTETSLSYPSNTFIEISYNGECDGQWKTSFNYLQYYIINKCNVAYEIDDHTFSVGCNSTYSWVTQYSGEVCTVNPIATVTNQITDNCGDLDNSNYIDYCNI
ncbi:hypothetical protein ACTA71_005496 [Dictyostelium dimigraforme]